MAFLDSLLRGRPEVSEFQVLRKTLDKGKVYVVCSGCVSLCVCLDVVYGVLFYRLA